MKLKDDKLIDASRGVNPLGPSNKVKSAIRKAVKRINDGPPLKTEGIGKLFASKFGLLPENVLFANSLKELIYLVPHVLNPKRVLIAGPAPDIYREASLAACAEVLHVNASEEDEFSLDVARLWRASENADLVFLANPNRITGKMISREAIGETLSKLSAGPHFVIDESLIEFAGSEWRHADIMTGGNVTIVGTTAYYYGMPGLELAYAVSSADMIHLYNGNRHWEINLLSAEAARTAYKDVTFRKASRQYLLGEMNMFVRMLNKINWIRAYDTDSNVILIKIARDAAEVICKLRKSGFDIKGCADIGDADGSFFRLSVMRHEHNLKFISALKGLDQ